jgi:hypothetical protein
MCFRSSCRASDPFGQPWSRGTSHRRWIAQMHCPANSMVRLNSSDRSFDDPTEQPRSCRSVCSVERICNKLPTKRCKDLARSPFSVVSTTIAATWVTRPFRFRIGKKLSAQRPRSIRKGSSAVSSRETGFLLWNTASTALSTLGAAAPRTQRSFLPMCRAAGIPFIAASAGLMARKRIWKSRTATPTTGDANSVGNRVQLLGMNRQRWSWGASFATLSEASRFLSDREELYIAKPPREAHK